MQTLSLDFDVPRIAGFDRLPPSQAHSQTSIEAAEAMRPSAGTVREAVMDYLIQHGPATDMEIFAALVARRGYGHLKEGTSRARRVELVAAGLVADSLVRVPTGTGRSAAVWKAVEN